MNKNTKRVVPAFATEAEEAEWWFQNRDIHSKQLLAAVKAGAAQTLTAGKLRERIAASKKAPAPVVALRIPEADMALARKQAERKGLPYQTYIKSLLHETLTEREKRNAGWQTAAAPLSSVRNFRAISLSVHPGPHKCSATSP